MKKETVVFAVVIAFFVGFITGATVAILRTNKDIGTRATVRMPQATSPAISTPTAPDPEMASKIKALTEIVQKDPKNLPAWVELGNLYFDNDQPREAIEAYSKYLAVKPENPDVRTDMAIMYRRLGDPDRALQEFRQAAHNDPKHINSRFNIGIVLLHDKQDIKGAIKAWEEYLKVDPNSERANRVRAQMENLKKMAK
ncbi:MAG: tetratricopeptide repeat protein [Thermodesulfobacteriota bacterium]